MVNTVLELLLALGPEVQKITDFFDPKGVEKPDGTLDHWPTVQNPNCTVIRFRFGAVENEKGEKISPLKASAHYAAIQLSESGQWFQVRDYPPGMFVAVDGTERSATLPVNSQYKDWVIVEWVQAAAAKPSK